MPTWGLSSTGFYRPRFAEIRTEMAARWRARFGANRNVASDTVDGHFIDIISEAMALTFEGAEAAYTVAFLDTAAGVALDQWAAGQGFVRRAATRSTVTLVLAGTSGTVIPAGSRLRLVDSGELWELVAQATIGGGGTVSAAVQAVNAGAVTALASSTWAIVNPITGWTGATNALDAVVGDAEESDADFRSRIRLGMGLGGVGAAVLRVPGVETVTIFQNDTDVPDGTYGETHWVEAMVVGGDDVAIANAIWQSKGQGIGTVGNDSAIETVTGDGNVVYFTRPVDVPLYVEIDITAGEGFIPSTAQGIAIREEVVAWANANHAAGDDVAPAMLLSRIPAVASGRYSAVIRVDDVTPAVTTGIFTITDRQVARFDTSRCTVVIS
ncbi:MAG: baseplate J/gp47 family protein [Deltaproteobacteria bacterium]|nr:baseplate J/gp47 family protein [Deltaproteobacteria bacterium]